MNNKGQIFSYLPYIFVGVILVFVFAIIVIISSLASDEILDELKEPQNFGSSNITVEKINQVQNLTVPAFDQMIFLFFVGIILATFVIAIFTDYHPVVLGVFIIVMVLLVIVSGLLVNAFDDVRNNPELSDKAEQFNMINLIYSNVLPAMFVIVGVVGTIILLSKRGRTVGA